LMNIDLNGTQATVAYFPEGPIADLSQQGYGINYLTDPLIGSGKIFLDTGKNVLRFNMQDGFNFAFFDLTGPSTNDDLWAKMEAPVTGATFAPGQAITLTASAGSATGISAVGSVAFKFRPLGGTWVTYAA